MSHTVLTPPGATDTSVATERGGKYLTFALGREEYGIGILKVREIIGFMDVTAVPHSPPYVRGVINLRGQVIGVVDLRARFAMAAAERTEQTCIIVVEVDRGKGRQTSVGIVVDRVCEVLDVPADRVEDPPDFGTSVDSAFILGMGKVGQSVKILLDIDHVLSTEEIEQLRQAA